MFGSFTANPAANPAAKIIAAARNLTIDNYRENSTIIKAGWYTGIPWGGNVYMPIVVADRPLDKVVDKSSDALYAQIVERIRQWIREGRLREGDPLPSERELAQMFDVSRVPVREALKILEFLGAVQHIRGKGVFVKKININQVLDNIDFVMMDPVHTLLDLFEAREAIEFQATRLAATRRTAQDIAAMEAAIIEMDRNIIMGRDVAESSLKFHSAVIDAAHNEVLLKINDFLADLLSYSRRHSLKDPGRHEIALGYHKQILQKIREQDADGAVTVMQEHLSRAKEVIMREES
jgi:GntR family transcriptional repressor for pyruvate dehydrogenase complex